MYVVWSFEKSVALQIYFCHVVYIEIPTIMLHFYFYNTYTYSIDLKYKYKWALSLKIQCLLSTIMEYFRILMNGGAETDWILSSLSFGIIGY